MMTMSAISTGASVMDTHTILRSASISVTSFPLIHSLVPSRACFAVLCFTVTLYSSLLLAICIALRSSKSTYFRTSSSMSDSDILPRLELNTSVSGLSSAVRFKKCTSRCAVIIWRSRYFVQ